MKSLFVTGLTDVKTTDVEGVGTLRYEASGAYRWVKNEGTTTTDSFTAGDVCCHRLAATANFNKYVTLPATADLMCLAGVVMGTLTYATYGWIQVLGYNETAKLTNTTNVTVTAGCYLKAVNAQKYLALDVAITPSYRRTIQAIDAFATGTTPATASKKCFIHCI